MEALCYGNGYVWIIYYRFSFTLCLLVAPYIFLSVDSIHSQWESPFPIFLEGVVRGWANVHSLDKV